MSDFEGFPEQTFEFLKELSIQNDRDWFNANRFRYEAYYLKPALAFIEAIGPRLSELPGEVRFEPRVNGSLFRINRDVRFSRDKRPYKDHIDMWFWQGDKKGWETPGYFMRLMPDSWAIGAGMHHLGKHQLDLYRAAVLDGATGGALEQAVARVQAAGAAYDIGGSDRKTVPRGYDPAHSRSPYLLHEGLFAIHHGALPPEAGCARFVDVCMSHFKAGSPISEWLASVIT